MAAWANKAPRLCAALLLALSGCDSVLIGNTADGRPNAEDPDAVWGFSFVRDFLAGLPRPGGIRSLDEDLAWMAGEGITLLVSLTEAPTSAEKAAEHGIELLHLPIEDFHAPTQEQFSVFVATVAEVRDANGKVAVHCAAGRGRTGTMLAAWFISEGMTADEAIDEIRELRPGSIETSAQIDALYEFASGQAQGDGRPNVAEP